MLWKCGLTCTSFFDIPQGLWWSRTAIFASSFSRASTCPNHVEEQDGLFLLREALDDVLSRPFVMVRWNCFFARVSAPVMDGRSGDAVGSSWCEMTEIPSGVHDLQSVLEAVGELVRECYAPDH